MLSGNEKADVGCLEKAGMSAAPADATSVAVGAAKYPCRHAGGLGAVREFAEHILLQNEKVKSKSKQDEEAANEVCARL